MFSFYFGSEIGSMNKKWLIRGIGMGLGILGGYLYYHFEGCKEGCPITGSPFTSSLFGGWMGFLTFSLFEKS